MLFLFSCVLLLCGSVGPSRDGSRQRVGIFFFFNEVCPHFVHPATRARESVSLRGFDLLLSGLQRSLLESASSEVVASPCAPQLAGEKRRQGPGTAAGGNATLPELGRFPPPPQLSSREREQGSKTQSGRRAREERFWSFKKSFPEIRKRKESERELAKRGGRRGRPPGKVGDRKAEAMKPGPPGTGSTGLDHRTELGNSGSRTVQERNRGPEPGALWGLGATAR